MTVSPLGVLQEAFDRAAAARPGEVVIHQLRLAGHSVRFQVVGRRLAADFLRALSHLETEAQPGPPALTVSLWDGAVTGVPCPFRYTKDAFTRTRSVGDGVVASNADETVIGFHTPAAFTALDRSDARMVGWVAGVDALTDYETGKPLQSLLFAWYRDRGVIPIHAGFAARAGAGVLLGGVGGSGKTTASLTCLNAGFDFLGDDYVGLAPAASGFRALSLYSSIWLEPEHAKRFPWVTRYGPKPRPGEKCLFYVTDVRPERVVPTAQVVAVVLPRVVGHGPTITRSVRPAEALRRLAPSTILQLPFVEPTGALERLGELVAQVPCFALDLGERMAEIPESVDAILQGLS